MIGGLDVALKLLSGIAAVVGLWWIAYQFFTRKRPKHVVPVSPQPTPPVEDQIRPADELTSPGTGEHGIDTEWWPESRSHYEQALMDWQNPTGIEQNLVVVATYGCQARAFESEQQMALARLLVQYMDASRDGVRPQTWQGTVWFEAVSPSGRGVLRARIYADGAIILSLTETFDAIPWDWALAEGYLLLKALQDHSLRETFVASTEIELMMILGQIPAGGIALKGLRGSLAGVEPATPADYSRNSIRRPYTLTVGTDPWETAVQFSKAALADTGHRYFEKDLARLRPDNFLAIYCDTVQTVPIRPYPRYPH